MLLALLLGQLVLQPADPRGPIVTNPATMRRLAFFEAFPSNGAGTSGACSTTPPTGAKGEVLTFTRASNGTCTKTATGGLATTGIADGDLVVLSSNQPRVEYDSGGVLGLLVEASRTNVNLQSANLANGIYSNVGTPTVTANTTVSPDGTTTMATIQDTSGAALEGRSQTVTVTAGQPYTLSVFVKAGTLSAVTVSLDGTTATCTSLSATTSTRCIVTDASASGAAIVASVTAGTVVSDTGSFKAWGQQVEQGNYASSYIPTGAGTATLGAELGTFAVGGPALGSTWSIAATVTTNHDLANAQGVVALNDSVNDGTPQALIYTTAGQIAGFSANPGTLVLSGVVLATGLRRVYFTSERRIAVDATSVTGAAATTNAITTLVSVGGNGAAGIGPPDAIISRVCADPADPRCR